MTGSCAQTHFGSLGGTQQFQTWLVQRETGYNSVGCQHLQSVVNWITNQLNSGVTANNTPLTQVQITRKTAKRDWAICQAQECGCGTLNMPLVTGPPSTPEGGTTVPPSTAPPEDDAYMKETKVMSEEFTRMKSLWKYKI